MRKNIEEKILNLFLDNKLMAMIPEAWVTRRK
jgi:hypothetical protein